MEYKRTQCTTILDIYYLGGKFTKYTKLYSK